MAGVRVDSGQLPMLSDIDIRHKPSRSMVITRWINSMTDAEEALQAIGPILREVEKYKLWELEHYATPELTLQRIGIDRVAESLDGVPQLIAEYADRLRRGKPAGKVIGRIEHVATAELVRMARERPIAVHGAIGNGRESRPDNVRSTQYKGYGNAKAYTLRRLARDRPDLLDKVEAGELSPNAAAIEAGFRRKLTPLEQAMKMIAKLTADDRAALAEWLSAAQQETRSQ